MPGVGGPDVESVLRQLGNPGPYQCLVCVLLCLNYFPVALNHVVMVFYKYAPAVSCADAQSEVNGTSSQRTTWPPPPGAGDACNSSCSGATTNFTYHFGRPGESSLVSEWGLMCARAAWPAHLTSVYFAGVMAGGVVVGGASDRLGRRPCMLACLLAHLVVGVAIYFAPSLALFAALRFFQGAIIQGLQATTFVMLLELFPQALRTTAGVVVECAWALGVMYLALLGWLLPSWRHLQLAITLPSLLAAASYFVLVPESLRWLLAMGRARQAREVFQMLLRRNCVTSRADPEDEEIFWTADVNGIKTPKAPTASILDMFKTRKLRLYSFVMFYIWFCAALVYYGLTLGTSSLAGNRFFNLFLSGAVELPAYLAALFILNRFGRKWPLVLYFTVAGLGCILSVALPQSQGTWVGRTCALVGKFAVAGCMSVIFLYASELFPTVIRNLAFGACAFWLRVGALVAPQINRLDKTGSGTAVIVFGCSAFLGAALTLLLPETLSRQLEDNISSGDAVETSTNCEEVMLGDAVNQLKGDAKEPTQPTIGTDL